MMIVFEETIRYYGGPILRRSFLQKMAEQENQSPEPLDKTPDEFIAILKKRMPSFMPVRPVSRFKIVSFHGKSQKAVVKIDNLEKFVWEKSVDEIKKAIFNSVLYIDVKVPQDIRIKDVITMMQYGAEPLARAGIIDVLTTNIDECPEGSLTEPIHIRKTRLSQAFTGILGDARVLPLEQETEEEEDDMSQGNLDKMLEVMNRRFTILENHISRTKDEVKSEITRTKDQVKGEFESKVNNVRDELRGDITSLQNAARNEFETVNEKIDILLGNNSPKPETK